MEETNLLAFFQSLEDAEKCQYQLRDRGFDVVQIDRVSANMSREGLIETSLVNWGRHDYNPERLDDKWTLGDFWEDGKSAEAWILTAVVSKDDGDDAAKIIRQFGGQF